MGTELHTLYVRIPKADAEIIEKLSPLYGSRTRMARIFFHELAKQTSDALKDPEFVRKIAADTIHEFLAPYGGTVKDEGAAGG